MDATKLPAPDVRIALGCMRLSTDADADESRAVATLHAAIEAGITLFDTAHAYAPDGGTLGENERLLARVFRERAEDAARIRIVTKGGMRRPDGRWEPDGRARSLREDCEASLAALDGLPIDLYLVHAPDPRVPWATTVRALASLLEARLVRRIGVSNVNRRQLDEALAIAPLAAVELAFGPFAETALRGGVVARAIEAGLDVLAHSPLGGPERAAKLARDEALARIGARHGVTAQRIALAAIADLHPRIIPLVGARRPESVRTCATEIHLDEEDRAALERRFGWKEVLSPTQHLTAESASDGPEVVLLMGIQGAGKSTLAAEWAGRGYERLNRDERTGTMADLHRALEKTLAGGARRIVLDNTYTTRATRQVAIEVARRHRARVLGVWLDTPLAEAQANVVFRMLEAHDRLLEPDQIARARDPSSLGPGALARLMRELEPPVREEGFASLEHVPFVRRPRADRDRIAELVALEAALRGVRPANGLGLVFGWKPDVTATELAELATTLGVPVRCCPHPGGPPRCWCRPPLPGLLLEFAVREQVDLGRSVVLGTKPVHAAIARAAGALYRDVSGGRQSAPSSQ
jgi:aryl-alcohol dehydrogenase-like predicted oxidoreductase/predicted kinase